MPPYSPFCLHTLSAESTNYSANRINKHKQDHSANRYRNKKAVKLVCIIDKGMPIPGWREMTDPAVRKVCGGIRVASAAGVQKVLFNDGRIRGRCFLNIVNSMAIGAYGRIDLLIRMLLFEQCYGQAMKISDVRIENVWRNAVFAHQIRIAVAYGAKSGRFQPEGVCFGIRLIMRVMAIRTHRHIGIAVYKQRFAMGAINIFRIYFAVASAAAC
jgi:hypothetical protein